LAGDSVYKPDTLKEGEDVVGMVLAVPWHIQNNRPSEFVQTADQLWGGDVNWRSAMAYDATQALIAAITTSPSPRSSEVAQVLSRPGFSTSGASGTVRFLPSGDRNQAAELVTIKQGTRSGFGYDFVLLP
jgi:branched-chain amino acid transport system substrate-binding protein